MSVVWFLVVFIVGDPLPRFGSAVEMQSEEACLSAARQVAEVASYKGIAVETSCLVAAAGGGPR